ncbi:hypothetical protein CAMGR0001_1071 [Campylobacter gracilis RM3268]|uniref:Uncharacterized protein n=1 Tax=Campylobacter gracilis RM3268 TaxID=553220 RepID=C8PGS6_9BACT|nr:hypothetical protein CAMGR0001_1071 [Campylobacter gracilis RM3268]
MLELCRLAVKFCRLARLNLFGSHEIQEARAVGGSAKFNPPA